MMVDPRTSKQALAGLFDTDMLMSNEFSRAPQPQAPQRPPMSIMEQMDERKGKFKNRLGLFSHLMLGGDASEYGDADLLAQRDAAQAQEALTQKMGLLQPYIEGLNSDDPNAQAQSMLALSQAGVTEDMMEMMVPGLAPSDDTDIMRTTKAYVDSHNKDNPDSPISFHEGYDIVKNYDAGRRGDQAGAVANAQSDVQQYTSSRDAYITAVEQDAVLGDRIANVDKGLQMLESGAVDTGPVVGFLANTFGMGSKELGELQQMSITEAMEALQMFKGPTTDFEFTKAELKSFAQIFTGEDLNIGTLRAARDSLEKVRKRNMLSGKSHLDAVREYGSDEQYNRLNSVFAQPEYWSGSRGQATVRAPQASPQAPAPTQNPAGRAPMPAVGANVNGYVFKGGNPNDKNNWEKAQ